METEWKKIWNSKNLPYDSKAQSEFNRFCELKKANGFDVAVGDEEAYFKSFYIGWLNFYKKILDLIGDEINSIFEVGCGSGVNLYMFSNRLPKIRGGGVDYSENMIKCAKSVLGSGDFSCCEADKISVIPKYDLVMAESVFQYFESLEYAETVLSKMLEKSQKLTYIGEIHDKKYEVELIEYRRQTIANYDEKYKGLKKLFIDKEWVEDIAEKHGKRVYFTMIDNPEYINGKYEYNCYIL